MGLHRPGKVRFTIYLSLTDELLLKFAMKATGLDKTSTLRLMMREGVIQRIAHYKKFGVPRLPAELQKLIDEF